MRRTDRGGILTAVFVAVALASAPAGAQGWKEHYDAGVKARIAGDCDQAELLMKRSLAAAEAPGGGGTHAVVETLVGFSDIYFSQQRMAEAAVVLDQALLLLVRAPEPEPADLAQVYNSLASLRALQKNYAESEGLLKRALAIREKVLGPNHTDVASTLNQIADMALIQEHHAEAETYARRALAVREAQADANPLELAKAYHTLAGLNAFQKNYPEADALFRRVVALTEKALGPDHPGVASALMEQASVRLVKGVNKTLFSFLTKINPAEQAIADKNKADAGFPETAALLARALAIRDKALGPDDPKTVEVVLALAVTETKQEDYARAEPYLKRLLATREKTLGPDHSEVVEVVDELADNALYQRQYRAAIPLLKRLIAARDADAAKGPAQSPDPYGTLGLRTGGEAEKDDPTDLDAKLRRTVRLANRDDDPALRPTEADLAFLKRGGAMPADATLAALDDLLKVDLDGQPLDDARMVHFRGLVNLKSLSLRPAKLTRTSPNLTDAGLVHLQKLTDLRHLNLSGTTVHGAGLDHLAGMTGLAQLDLSFTLIDDAGLSHLPTFPKLHFLNLSGTKVTDASMPMIKKQTGLTYLGLLGTKISAAAVKELKQGRASLNVHWPDGTSDAEGFTPVLRSAPPDAPLPVTPILPPAANE